VIPRLSQLFGIMLVSCAKIVRGGDKLMRRVGDKPEEIDRDRNKSVSIWESSVTRDGGTVVALSFAGCEFASDVH